MLIAFIALENLTSPAGQFSGWSDGFTEIKDKTTGGAAGASIGIAYKISDGTEGLNITVTSVDAERAAHAMYRISNASAAAAVEVSAGASGNSVNADPDNLIPVGLTKDYMYMAMCGYEKDDFAITAFPSGYTNSVTVSQFSGATIGIATKNVAAAAENPPAYTQAGAEEWQAFTLAITPLGSAAAGGTIVVGVGTPVDEFDIVDGGKFLLITLTDEELLNAGAAFDGSRQAIIDGITSFQSELLGWNNEVRDKLSVTDVTRAAAKVAKIDFPASAAYLLTADEEIEVTFPASANKGGQTLVAIPTFPVIFIPQGVSLAGDVVPQDFEADIVAGGRTLVLTSNKDTWQTPFTDTERQAIIDGLTSAQVEVLGWNNEVRDKQGTIGVVLTDPVTVTITLDAQAAYDITADETITGTMPASVMVTGGPYVATPTFDIKVDPTAAVSGTATAGIVEADVVLGAKTIIIDLVGDTWQPNGMEFDGVRQAIIDGLDSAQAELTGWNNEVRDKLPTSAVIRTSATKVTITLTAQALYNITAQEVITVTVPASALVEASQPVIASPTFTVDPTAVAISGTTVPSSLELQIVNGGQTLILTLTGDSWVSVGPTFDAVRQAILDGLTSAQSEATGWNAEVRDKEVVGAVVRTSGTVVTITFSAAAAYNITTPETITATIPASAITDTPDPIVATPTFNVNQIPTAIVGGTIAFSSTEGQIRAGGRTILLFLTDDTWVATGGAFEAQRQAIIDGLVSAQSEATGWNAEIVPNIPLGAVVRTSDTLVTITLIPRNQYDITLLEEITVTIPGAALVTAVADLIALPDPGFQITPITSKGHARDRRGGAHAETGVDVNEPDANTYEVNTF
jgi:hypothetical protein